MVGLGFIIVGNDISEEIKSCLDTLVIIEETVLLIMISCKKSLAIGLNRNSFMRQ